MPRNRGQKVSFDSSCLKLLADSPGHTGVDHDRRAKSKRHERRIPEKNEQHVATRQVVDIADAASRKRERNQQYRHYPYDVTEHIRQEFVPVSDLNPKFPFCDMQGDACG